MKLMFASDIHGSAYYAKALCDRYEKERPDKLVLLGDLLYHGPRNDLPRDYDTKAVTALLNAHKNEILAVRGNCDAEVDQMVLEFPILADYAALFDGGRMFFLTHGHLFHEDHLPNFNRGDVLIHGHTHERVLADRGAYIFLNPGSVALPKGDGQHSYAVYEDGVFITKSIEGTVLETLELPPRCAAENDAKSIKSAAGEK
ncbi:MAG: phosphodiesterase [Ruthenibacterium sp.]